MPPYHSINQEVMRRLVSNLVKETTSRGMHVISKHCRVHAFFTCMSMLLHQFVCKSVGFCSNGEYNSLRNQGYTRPLSILLIRSDIRCKYPKMSKQAMTVMLTPQGELASLFKSSNNDICKGSAELVIQISPYVPVP